MTFEQELGTTLAIAVNEQLAPLRERIKQLETQVIELRAELRLVKELTFANCRDDKSAPLLFPGAANARSRCLS